MFQAAVTFGLDNFKRTLLSFFEQHTREIFASKSFNELSDTTLSYILQSDDLNIDEFDLVKAVKGWAVVNAVSVSRFDLIFILPETYLIYQDYIKKKSTAHISFCRRDIFLNIGIMLSWK